ncbi:MAG TPA: ABC transporter ATP-binding protein [Casimicrobiaceae bacterium]|nr:ABC transporter ATP-binding protein [Casimicrobiaceae bacterium]
MPDDTLLTASDVSRRFGGLTAVDRASIALVRGEVHAVIGTNGAGKSTLVNVLSGEIAASSGRVHLHGRDVTHWPQPRRSRAGIGRSYQRTTIFRNATVFENCRLAAQAHFQHPLDLWTRAQRCPQSREQAEQAIEQAGLTAQAQRVAGTLSHGQKRQLEIAMCLATAPTVLLLDEPLAGIGPDETERMLALLAGLKRGRAVLLVEHDMDAVFRIADRITVMVNGTVIASAEPGAIRGNAAVQAAYLGDSCEPMTALPANA